MNELTRPRSKLTEMLSRTLGSDKAAEIVNEATQTLGYGRSLNREQALLVLEHIAQNPGIVGIAARFAKSRVHMIWSADTREGTRSVKPPRMP